MIRVPFHDGWSVGPQVTVTVAGAGELAALGSSRGQTSESFAGPSRLTHDGRALAVVRGTGRGQITVTVTAPGYAPAVVRVVAGEASAR